MSAVLPERLPCPECGAPPATPHPPTCRTQAARLAYFADFARRAGRKPAAEIPPCWACDAQPGQAHLPKCPDFGRDPAGVYRGGEAEPAPRPVAEFWTAAQARNADAWARGWARRNGLEQPR